MVEEKSNALFEMDDEGWIAQNKGRDLEELFRELLQNALDSGGDVTIKVDSRKKQIEIIDDGDGINRIEDVWQVFGGDKGKDPTKRGRFGRGLKEFVACTDYTKVQTTSGEVVFDVENRQRSVDPEAGRDNGTRVVARSDGWKIREVKGIWEYVSKIWCPENQNITLDVKGGRTIELERYSSDFTYRTRLQTVVYDEEKGEMGTTFRSTTVHVRRAEGQHGRLYEMGIPVDLQAPFPFYIDVQQKIPLAEQRNEPDSWFYNRHVKPGLVEELYENGIWEDMTDAELKADWFTEALNRTDNTEAKEVWVDRIIADGRKKGLAVYDRSVDEHDKDRVEQQGYQTYDLSRASSSVASIVKEGAAEINDVLKDIQDQTKRPVPPNPRQQDFMNFAEELAREVGYPDVEFETWRWEPAPDTRNVVAENGGDGVIRLNVNENDWDGVREETLGTVLHEIAHEKGIGHGEEWWRELETIAARLLIARM